MDQRWILALFIAVAAFLILLMILFWPAADPEPRPEDTGSIEEPAPAAAAM